MRHLCAAAIAVALISSTAFAASDDVGALAAGKPAGVKTAQSNDPLALYVLGGVAVVGLIALGVETGSSTKAATVVTPATT